jgi:NitT/TauT family transport system substrate-binding protein
LTRVEPTAGRAPGEISRRGWISAAASLALASAPGCRRAHPSREFSVGYVTNFTHAQPLVGAHSGRWARALGGKIIAFPAGPAVMEALAAGSIHAGFLGPSAALNAFVRSRGRRGIILSGAASGGASLVSRRGLDLTSPEALRHRVISASQIASTPDVSLRAYLRAHHLAPRDQGGDVTVLPMTNTEAFQLLKRGHLDGSWAQEPWASRMVLQGGGQRAIDERDLWPGRRFPTSLLATTQEVRREAASKIEILLGLLADETARLGKLADGGAGEVADALAAALGKKLPPDVLREAWSRLELTDDPIPSALERFADEMRATGYLPPGSLEGLVARGGPTARQETP